jgi:hypothetical protein
MAGSFLFSVSESSRNHLIRHHWAQLSPEDPFPLGDGTADTEAVVQCPCCGERVLIAIDPGSGPAQEYVEDCPVCCRPWQVRVTYRATGEADVLISAAEPD